MNNGKNPSSQEMEFTTYSWKTTNSLSSPALTQAPGLHVDKADARGEAIGEDLSAVKAV